MTRFVPSTQLSAPLLDKWKDLLCQPLKDEGYMIPIQLSDFSPYTKFVNVKFLNANITYLRDNWNQKNFYTQNSKKRWDCLVLSITTPFVHAVSVLLLLVNRIAKIVSLAHLWHRELENDSCRQRLWYWTWDLLQAALAPILYVGLQLSAVYGVITPNNGAKIYATLERALFARDRLGHVGILAPSFQPKRRLL